MFDFSKQFISFGIRYSDEKFERVKNRKIFSDYNFPPTKPMHGGLWASEYFGGKAHSSRWHQFVNEKLRRSIFDEKLNGESTVFKLKRESKVFLIADFSDIKLEFPDGYKEANRCLHVQNIGLGPNIDLTCATKWYIDHEKVSESYDALYISYELIKYLEVKLAEYDQKLMLRTLSRIEEQQQAELICKAQLFEDWHVDTLLIYNDTCIEIIEMVNNRRLERR